MLWDEPKIFFLERRYFFSIILSEFLKNRVALQFLRELTARRVKNEHLPHVSVGYACFNPVLGSVEDAIKRADRTMYHYKRKRKSEALTNDDTVKS